MKLSRTKISKLLKTKRQTQKYRRRKKKGKKKQHY